jgi:preprotein translocase subunit SecF
MRIFENLNFDFLGKRKIFYVISAVVFLLGMVNIIFRGLELGIDFKGGTEVVLQFEHPVSIGEMRGHVDNIGLGTVEVKTFGGETGLLFRTDLQRIPPAIFPLLVENVNSEIERLYPRLERRIVDSTTSSVVYEFPSADTTASLIYNLSQAGYDVARATAELENRQMIVSISISSWLKDNLRTKVPDNPFTVLREEHVGPKIGEELKRDAVIAVFFALIVILIYLGFRFKFVFALGAVVALFHDVLITLGLYSILYGVIPGLNLEIDLTVVAAFLTLVGYSINDTVIVFDRVRENLKIHKTQPVLEVINRSINQTMSRTIITGVTTLITVFVLMLLGGDVLRAFAFTLFFGIIIGTYSSIFVASALVLEYSNRAKKKVSF